MSDEADRALRRAWSLGFYEVEVVATTEHVSAFVWRKYHRNEGRSAFAPTVAEAIDRAVERVLDREASTGLAPVGEG